jgi:hypothetical protein
MARSEHREVFSCTLYRRQVLFDMRHPSLCFELCEVDEEDTSGLAKLEDVSLRLHTVICTP